MKKKRNAEELKFGGLRTDKRYIEDVARENGLV